MTDTWSLTVQRDFDVPVETLFDHWTSPEARARWEVGEGTGMRYDAFDTREGATEIVRVVPEGKELGFMTQQHLRIVPNSRIVTCVAGHFSGVVTMVFLLTMRFDAIANGSRLTATSQMSDLSGTNSRKQHEDGWDWMFGRFEADLAAHGSSRRAD